MTARRSKLEPENVNMLVYLRENLGKVQIEKLVLEDAEEQRIEKECMAEEEKAEEEKKINSL